MTIWSEEINEGVTTTPSKRFINHLPLYDWLDVRVGTSGASALGLPGLRARWSLINILVVATGEERLDGIDSNGMRDAWRVG